jgi:hypothetical protein
VRGVPAGASPAYRGRLRGVFRGAFRVLDLLARLHARGGERDAGMRPAGLRGDTCLPRLRRAHLPSDFLRDPDRTSRAAVITLDGSVGSTRGSLECARAARRYSGRHLRTHRPIFAHHKRGRSTTLYRDLHFCRCDARACELYAKARCEATPAKRGSGCWS